MKSIFLLKLGQLVGLDRFPLRFRVDAEQLGDVEAENLIFDRISQRRILVFLHQLLVHFQLAETDDLALRAAVPDGIGAPEDVVGAGRLNHLSEHVHTHLRPIERGHVESAAQLKIDILDFRIALEDAEDIADPGNLLRIIGSRVFDLFPRAAGQGAEAAKTGMIHHKVQVRPIEGRFLQIDRRARLLVEETQRQPFVDT